MGNIEYKLLIMRKEVETYMECAFKFRQVILEHAHYLGMSGLPTRDFDTIGGSRCHIDHFLKFRVFES